MNSLQSEDVNTPTRLECQGLASQLVVGFNVTGLTDSINEAGRWKRFLNGRADPEISPFRIT